MIFGLLGSLITGGIGLAKEYIGGEADKKRLKLENEKISIKTKGEIMKASAEAKAKAMLQRMQGDIAYENIWSKSAMSSWKDEFWTILLGTPYIACMVPAVVGTGAAILTPVLSPLDPAVTFNPDAVETAVATSFEMMKLIPNYWNAAASVGIGASFGVKKYEGFKAIKKGIQM